MIITNEILKNIEELVEIGVPYTKIAPVLKIDLATVNRYARAIKEIKETKNLSKKNTSSVSVNRLKGYFATKGITFTVDNSTNKKPMTVQKKDDEIYKQNNSDQIETIINGMRSIYVIIIQMNRSLKKMCSLWETSNEKEETTEDSEYIKRLYEAFEKNSEGVV